MVASKNAHQTTLILLRPNRSASWQDTKRMVLLLSCPIAIIAVCWSYAGVWLILPFAGLEVGLLALLMYQVSKATYQQQLIRIARGYVDVELSGRPKQITRFSRPQCFVQITESDNDWPLPSILLVAPEGQLEVGQFLNLADRRQLRDDLQRGGLAICRTQWWKQ